MPPCGAGARVAARDNARSLRLMAQGVLCRTKSATFPYMAYVVAHRGASGAHPPGNTIDAFRAAGPLGAGWVELDVHLSADGEVVVHHDPVLADGRDIGDLLAGDLPAGVPLLGPVLEVCRGLGVNVEIKPDGPIGHRAALIAGVIDLMEGLEAARALVTSFEREIIDEVRRRRPSLPTGFLMFEVRDVDRQLSELADAGHSAVNPWDPLVNDAFMAAARRAGLSVNVWTVDDPERMRMLLDLGVDGIITNHPDVARAIVDGVG